MEESQNILNEEKDELALCFSSIRSWKESDINGRGKAWINIYGVPLHAWNDQMFRKVGNRLGRVLEIDEATSSRLNLRLGRVLVETPFFSKINRNFQYKIWDKIYVVHAVENSCVARTEFVDFASAVGDDPDLGASKPEFSASDDEEDDLSVQLFDQDHLIDDNREVLVMKGFQKRRQLRIFMGKINWRLALRKWVIPRFRGS